MDFDIQSLIQAQKVFVSPKELTDAIVQSRVAKVSAKKPGFQIAFPTPMVSFVWLFCVFASLCIAVFSFTLVGRMTTKTTYKLLPIFLGGSVGIPLVSSIWSLQHREKRYRAELLSCQRSPITEGEIVEYFQWCKSNFMLQYDEYLEQFHRKFNPSPDATLSRQTRISPEMVRVQKRVADTVTRLEELKNNYLSRLESLEKDFIEQLNQGQEELMLESAAEFELVLENLDREVDIANTYLNAAGEVDRG